MQLGVHKGFLAKTWAENQTLTPLQNHKEERGKKADPESSKAN